MTLKVTFDDASDFVKRERILLHAWATKHPFLFGAICLATPIVVGWAL